MKRNAYLDLTLESISLRFEQSINFSIRGGRFAGRGRLCHGRGRVQSLTVDK